MTARAVREPGGDTVVERLHVASTARERMRGLLGRTSLAEGEGMWFPRCRLIHTFGMRFPIDLVYMDEGRVVRKVVEKLRPGRLSACLGADSVIELNAGAVKAAGLCRGTKLKIVG